MNRTKKIQIGSSDWFLSINNIFFAIHPRPGLFRRFILRLVGFKIVSEEFVKQAMKDS